MTALALVAGLAACGAGDSDETRATVMVALSPFFKANPCDDDECRNARRQVVDDIVESCSGDFDQTRRFTMQMLVAQDPWDGAYVDALEALCPERLAEVLL